MMKLKVNNIDKNIRIDKWISSNSSVSRNEIKRLINESKILLNKEIVTKVSALLQINDEIEVFLDSKKEINIKPENIDIDIIYEDDYLVVVNKPSGMVVHPAPGHHSGTLVNALLYKFNNLSTIDDSQIRPGIVHRIDKDTSGLLIIAKDNETHINLANKLKDHLIEREYIAIIVGTPKFKKTHIKLPIKRDKNNYQKMAVDSLGKKAITHLEVIESYTNFSLVKCQLETGRTHQIRVHLAYIGNPILGDKIYGYKKYADENYGQFLHAQKIAFTHPKTNKKIILKAEIPNYFKNKWKEITNL